MVIKSKSAAEMTIGTIIIIVLGVVVLVFLIWGFSSGWNNLWGKILAFSGGSSNVDTIKQACALACSGNQNTQYCQDIQTVKNGDGTTVKGTCATLNYGGAGCSITCSNTPTTCLVPNYWKASACTTPQEKDITSDIQNSEGNDVAKQHCCSPQTSTSSNPTCTGSATACNAPALNNGGACSNQHGCTWNAASNPPSCTGAALACDTIKTNANNACNLQQGCTWK